MERQRHNEDTSRPITCIICDTLGSSSTSTRDLGNIIKISKGIANLKTASVKRQDGLVQFLESEFVYVHTICRQKYINKNYIDIKTKQLQHKSSLDPPKKKRRSDIAANFDWQKYCLICAGEANEFKERKKSISQRKKILYVSCMSLKNTLLRFVSSLQEDDFYREIHERISGIRDLQSLGAKYHADCYRSLRNTALSNNNHRTLMIDGAMKGIYKYIEENDDCQFSLQELKSIVSTEYIPNDKIIKSRLISKYRDNIIFAKGISSNTMVYLKKKYHIILSDTWYNEKSKNIEDEEFRILQAAGEIIRRSIRSQVYCNEYYSASDKMFKDIDQYIPKPLSFLLSEIIVNDKKSTSINLPDYEKKCKSIAHAIIAAVRPRSFLSPLHVALAVKFNRKFGSKKIINICNSLGFCASYKEAQLYEASAAAQNQVKVKEGTFVQFVHNIVDFNVDTIDGGETFQNLASIEIITPGDGIKDREPIKRLKNIPTETIAETENTSIQVYPVSEGVGFEKIRIKLSIKRPISPKPDTLQVAQSPLNILWMSLKAKNDKKIPGWNGFIKQLTNAQEFDKSTIVVLPFITPAPIDYDTVYTAMNTSVNNAKSLGMRTCVVTFDQPLFMKALDISSAICLSNDIFVVVRLGSFHTLMSFMGSIGYIMGGSGIKEALCTIYAKNTIDHIMSGRAYNRAVRAHILLHQSLSRLIIADLLETNELFYKILNEEENSTEFEMSNYKEIFETEQFKILADIFEKKLLQYQNRNITCKLWITYYRMVEVLKDFVAADKMGNWEKHLDCIELMIPFFYASGYFSYAKASQIYLQNMKQLQYKMDPAEYQKFTKGYFTTRRSDYFSSGISIDKTIVQTLMKSRSIESGPYKRGVTESIGGASIRGVIHSKDVIKGVEQFYNESLKKSYHQNDSTEGRRERDDIDVKKLDLFFRQHTPFSYTDSLMSNVTRVTGDKNINCHNAFEEGIKIMRQTGNKNLNQLQLSHKSKVNTFLTKKYLKIKINEDFVAVDPLFIFQRIFGLKESDQVLKNYMNYELAPYPLALFKDGKMRNTDQSTLYQIFPQVTIVDNSMYDNFYYVVDGDMLLYQCHWSGEEKMKRLCDQYVRYVTDNFGQNVYVVFDGNHKDSLKVTERNRRAPENTCPDVHFTEHTPFTVGRDRFLRNSNNKSLLINLLINKLLNKNIFSCQAPGDSDRFIVEIAIQLKSPNVMIVAEDIDILVLLTALTPNDRAIYFQKPPSSRSRVRVEQPIFSSKCLERTLPKCKEHILFLHAFAGCETTSAFFNKDKRAFASIFEKSKDLHDAAKVFKNVNEDPDNIFRAGVTCILALYNAPKEIKDLDTLRIHSLLEGTDNNNCVELHGLVPTSDAAFEHLKRVYVQVQIWLGQDISVEKWGWRSVSNNLEPITMNLPAVPDDLLNMLFCQCKNGCGSACGCRKSGLHCVEVCSECNGNSCLNASPIIRISEIEDDENEQM